MNAPLTYLFAFNLTLGRSDEECSQHSQREHAIIKKLYSYGFAWAPTANFVLVKSMVSLDQMLTDVRSMLWDDDFFFAARCGDFSDFAAIGHVWDEEGFASVLTREGA